ncbi:class A beta-lactamase [Aeromicrobium alkaliterrae]|uniref:Class A beta-lactamase Bla1 n=1 Tax=Aeromicrobium alkaliterrae TaxID=302168 RepID=A0ABN2JGD3_9ACTN
MRGFGATAAALVLLIGLGACSGGDNAEPGVSPDPSTSAPADGEVVDRSAELAAVEEQHDVRLGVYAIDTGSGDRIEQRADERFAFASTFKALLVGALVEERSVSVLELSVPISEDDLVAYAPQVEAALAEGRTSMTVGELADATVRFSDNAAGNLLLQQIGGPSGFQAALRAVGDDVTNSSRTEPGLNEATPGDDRDTTTPRAIADTLAYFAVDGAAPENREVLVDLMLRNTTGDALIRAGVPGDWQVADKTGSGGYGTRNDIAVVWPPGRDPIVVAILTSRDDEDADTVDAAVADAMRVVSEAFA